MTPPTVNGKVWTFAGQIERVIDLDVLAGRFWAKVTKTDTCWEWTGARHGKGYGHFRVGQRVAKAHRVALLLSGMDVPAGLTVDHLCRNTACVRPDHLELVTAGVNTLRSDNPPAQNARKTHCLRGHAFVPGNFVQVKNGQRSCLTCHRERSRAARARLRERKVAA